MRATMLMYANLMQGGRKWRLALSLHLVLLGAAATENKPNLRLCCRVAQRGTKVDSKAMYPRDRRRWKANNCDHADLWRCQHHDLKSAHSLTIDGRLSNAASSVSVPFSNFRACVTAVRTAHCLMAFLTVMVMLAGKMDGMGGETRSGDAASSD